MIALAIGTKYRSLQPNIGITSMPGLLQIEESLRTQKLHGSFHSRQKIGIAI